MSTRRANATLLIAMGVVALLLAVHIATVEPLAIGAGAWSSPLGGDGDSEPGTAVGGELRDVDGEQIRRLILQGRLSDHEADHYHPVGEEPHPPPDAGR